MHYFTPELFVRLQDLTDRAAPKEWDRAAERYSAALEQTLSRLPAAVKKLAGHYILHDAEILCIAQARDNFSITLQPELADGHLIVLSYTLVEDPKINVASFPVEYRTEHTAWLYDEIGLGEPGMHQSSGRRRTTQGNGQVPVYCHDILLSNGWEIGLRFRQVKVARPQQLLPASGPTIRNANGELSQSA